MKQPNTKKSKNQADAKKYSLLGRWLYIKKYIKDFKTLGSVAPSSKKASQFLAQQIQEDGYVLELGPGSGTVTQAIIDKIGYDRLISIEIDKTFYEHMRLKFPKLNIINASATDLAKVLPKEVIGNISTIVSTIPMLNLSKELIAQIIQSSFQVAKNDANFVQICYIPRSPIDSQALGLTQRKCGFVFWNIPPMTIFEYKKSK